MSKQSTGLEFEKKLEKQLHTAGIPFVRNPALAGASPDFMIRNSAGKRLVLEAKVQPSSRGALARAALQARFYKTITDSDSAAIVVPWTTGTDPTQGVVGTSDLEGHIRSLLGRKYIDSPMKESNRKLVLCAMPFAGQYEDTYAAMARSAKPIGATTRRIDQEEFAGDIVAKLKKDIRDSHALIADLSESNPNVFYEVGLAQGSNKPTVHVCSTPMEDLPFDLRNTNTISYEMGRTGELVAPLRRRLMTVLKEQASGKTPPRTGED